MEARPLFIGRSRSVLATILSLSLSIPTAAAAAETEEFFEAKVRPVLAGVCSRCHAGEEAKNGLRLDSRAGLVKGGRRGPPIVPGDPAGSLLIRAVRRTQPDLRMPPDQALPETVVADLERWVRDGAPWPDYDRPGAPKPPRAEPSGRTHWAFRPPVAVSPPEDPLGWSDHPLDRFIARSRMAKGLRPVAPAGPRELLRRLHFDLTGLPPSPEEVRAFIADRSPGAFEREVDRLLASPRYGERWGRAWLDVARYADTAGDNADYPIPEARLYRDYVIDSFNADKPYDVFIREQIAGDLLAARGPSEKYAEQVIATGFLALNRRYATGPYEFWHLSLEDVIDTLGQSMLGLTLRCARCHDHKFDPITTADYYALYGIFESTRFPWPGGEELESKKLPRQHFVSLLPPAAAAPLLDAQGVALAALRRDLAETEAALAKAGGPAKKPIEEKAGRIRGELQALERPGLPPGLPGACAVQEGTARNAAIQLSGDPGTPGAVVPRGAPAFLTSGRPLRIPEGQSGRLQFAGWLTRPDHPLTARVMVNRIWQGHFGRGLVTTPSNFGLRGAEPSHPELLDFLARRFVESGWRMKDLHRFILTSRTWQLSSDAGAEQEAIDTGNDLYWRHDRLRLDAEAIRDSMLQAAGLLDLSRPGPHPFPPFKDWHWTQHRQFKAVYPQNHRSVYLMTQRLVRHPFLGLFDGPDTNTTTAKRSTSTVPPQALYLMNSPEVREIAAAFARRLLAVPGDARDRIRRAHEICFSRPATEDEIAKAEEYLARYAGGLTAAGAGEDRRDEEAWTSYARVLFSSNEFFYVD